MSCEMKSELVERARFLAAGQDDPHSVTITELCDEIEQLRMEAKEHDQLWASSREHSRQMFEELRQVVLDLLPSRVDAEFTEGD